MTTQHQSVTAEPSFRFLIGNTDLQFHEAKVADPVPTGRQIIEVAGGHPPDEFLLLEWLENGELEEIELDETVDLRARGNERFVMARGSELFKFEIDGKRHSWPAPTITREALLAVAGQDPQQFTVWQEFQKQADEEIVAGHPAHLDAKGLERFYTVMKHTTEGAL
jgi:hypothetical protein